MRKEAPTPKKSPKLLSGGGNPDTTFILKIVSYHVICIKSMHTGDTENLDVKKR